MVTDPNLSRPPDSMGSPNFKNDVPSGFCPTCRMAKITRENIAICPNCDTKSATRSGLINNIEDPGVDEHGNIRDVPIKCTDVLKKGTIVDLSEAFRVIMASLDEVKVSQLKSMTDVRKITRFKKKLASLEIDIKDLIGE